MITAELKGMESIKAMFVDIQHQLSPAQLRSILDPAGQILAKEARAEVELKGELGTLFKQDIGVYRDNRKSAKSAEYIYVGPRFKRYTIRNQSGQKVALIAQHMTLGFHQTDRETQSGQQRGKVSEQVHNPMIGALQSKKNDINGAIEKGVSRQLDRTKTKYPEIVK